MQQNALTEIILENPVPNLILKIRDKKFKNKAILFNKHKYGFQENLIRTLFYRKDQACQSHLHLPMWYE